ncbi:MAG: hypothetical protein Q4F41_06825 [Eubacteriales bacterium]|nr:hypothetical protein [Eubacteriales bacterium]
MKKGKKLFGAVILALLLGMLCGTTTLAATKTKTLTANKWITNKVQEDGDVYYYKIVVPKPGYLTVQGYGIGKGSKKLSLSVRLCNNQKKRLETYKTLLSANGNYQTVYAVKKGTYYLQVESTNYKLKYSFKAVTEKSGASQSKAVKIAQNKTIQGLLQAGEKGNKTDYYKIVVKKAQRVTFAFTAKANSWIQFQVTSANANQSISGNKFYLWNGSKKVVSKSKFPAGTYYIQVSRSSENADTSGYYTIKWK